MTHMYFTARAEGHISYGHLGRTNLLFVIFMNDLPDTCSDFAEIFLFADDAKLCRRVRSAEDSAML